MLKSTARMDHHNRIIATTSLLCLLSGLNLLNINPLTLTLAGAAAASPSTSARSHYNEFCNKTIKCQPTSWLSCIDGLCQCAKPASMVFDPKRKKCVVKAGDTCKYRFANNDNDPTDGSVGSTDEIIRYEYLDCVQNANCQIGGICTCISNHYEDGNGTCLPQKLADAPCSGSGECRSDLGLVCYKGSCDCDPETTTALFDNTVYFDLQTESLDPVINGMDGGVTSISSRQRTKFCGGLPGQNCMQSKCAPHSSCYMKLNEVGQYNSTCVCNHGLILSKTGKSCKGNFGARCLSSGDCHEQFQCLNSRCTCKMSRHQVFDELTNQCRTIVSAPCNETEDCVVRSFCDKSNGNDVPFNSCQCDKGYVEFGPGFCRKGFGQSCGPQVDDDEGSRPSSMLPKQYVVDESAIAFMTGVDRQSFLTLNGYSQSRIVIDDKCDTASRLQCRNGKCDCEDEMETFDDNSKSCLSLVGSLCRRSLPGFSSGNMASLVCVDGAECVGSKSKPELARCECVKGFKATKERRCTKI